MHNLLKKHFANQPEHEHGYLRKTIRDIWEIIVHLLHSN